LESGRALAARGKDNEAAVEFKSIVVAFTVIKNIPYDSHDHVLTEATDWLAAWRLRQHDLPGALSYYNRNIVLLVGDSNVASRITLALDYEAVAKALQQTNPAQAAENRHNAAAIWMALQSNKELPPAFATKVMETQ
jgi:hypothetical protein